MRKLYLLLSVLFLIYWGCGKKVRKPIGEGFKVLNIMRYDYGGLEKYEMDILYNGDSKPESIVSLVKQIHNQYSELQLSMWLSENSYNKFQKQVIDGSKDSSNVIVSDKSYSKDSDYLKWVQIYGNYSELHNRRIDFKKYGRNLDDESDKENVIKDEDGSYEDIVEQYVTTDGDSRILSIPDPFDGKQIIRVPKNTRLKVLVSKDIQQGRMLNTWYLVSYQGKTGWTSGWNMKELPEMRILSFEESSKNYEKQIGKRPINNSWTGKIPEVEIWMKNNYKNYRNIKYIQWYKPYVMDNKWVCRVEFEESFGSLKIPNDVKFYVVNGQVIEVKDSY